MSVYLAGRDKPHRCPDCWRCSWVTGFRSNHWRIAKWFPRRCSNCGALTLTTRLRAAYEKKVR